MLITPGRQLAHYLVGEKLGEGGMGVVYKGTDTRLKRTIALKFLTRALPSDAAERKRFLREARAASAINHPNVCVIHAIEEVEEEEFIVMEFVEGVTLRKWARQVREAEGSTHVSIKKALAVVRQVAEGLNAAHKHGIVHRDVKPENVMIDADGRAKIMDFGLAKLAGESKLTRTGATVGTVAYMSPEQVQGGDIDAQTDIYSLGAVFYELLAGRTPFVSDHALGMMYAIVQTDPVPLHKAWPGVDSEVDAIVMRCLAKDKTERFRTMGDVIRRISLYEEMQRTVLAPPRGPGSTKRTGKGWVRYADTPRKYIAWLAAAAFVITAAVVYILAGNKADQQQSATPGGTHTITSVLPGGKESHGDTSAIARAGLSESRKDSVAFVPPGPKAVHKRTTEQLKELSSKKAVPGRENQPGKEEIAASRTGDEEKAAGLITLELFTNKGSTNPLFTEGDTMRTYIRVNRMCTIRVFYHTADGSHYLLTGPEDRTVHSSQINTLIPIDSSACSAPFGKETLQAFATPGRFETIRTKMAEAGYYAIEGDIDAALFATRGNTHPGGKSTVAEKAVHITTAAR